MTGGEGRGGEAVKEEGAGSGGVAGGQGGGRRISGREGGDGVRAGGLRRRRAIGREKQIGRAHV